MLLAMELPALEAHVISCQLIVVVTILIMLILLHTYFFFTRLPEC